jgi:hypothetical protein
MYFKYNNRVFQTPAAEEPPVAYLEARRVPGAELLCDALVCPAAERKRSADRLAPTQQVCALHRCLLRQRHIYAPLASSSPVS